MPLAQQNVTSLPEPSPKRTAPFGLESTWVNLDAPDVSIAFLVWKTLELSQTTFNRPFTSTHSLFGVQNWFALVSLSTDQSCKVEFGYVILMRLSILVYEEIRRDNPVQVCISDFYSPLLGCILTFPWFIEAFLQISYFLYVLSPEMLQPSIDECECSWVEWWPPWLYYSHVTCLTLGLATHI